MTEHTFQLCSSHAKARQLPGERIIRPKFFGYEIKNAVILLVYIGSALVSDCTMSDKTFPNILNEFRRYELLLAAFKTAKVNPIVTSPTKGGHQTEVGFTELNHPDPFEGLEFQVNIKPLEPHDYELKLFWREVEKAPVFRFESWGHVHRNPEDGRGLAFRDVPTPHFHRVKEEDGRMWAYKSDALNDPEHEKEICSDFAAGVKHFCHEAKIHDSEGSPLILTTQSNTLKLSTIDPLQGVTF